MNKKSVKQIGISYLCVVLAVAIDQIAKYLVSIYLKGQEAIALIPGVFELKYLENTSAAFSFDPVTLLHKIFHISYFDANPDAFLWSKMAFFALMTIVVLFFILMMYPRIPLNRHWLPLNLICLGILAGSIGNFIDRLFRRYVIDFFYFKLIDFPIFNVADIFVTVSAFSLVFVILFFYQEEDIEVLFPPKNKKVGEKNP